MQQAAAVYTRIVDPGNGAGGVLSSDVQDKVPFSQYQRDAALYVTAVQRQEAELRAVRWPAKIQPYITAMLLTDTPLTFSAPSLSRRRADRWRPRW